MDTIIQKVLKRRGIVEVLLRYPDREFTINELSRLAGVPYASAWRFVKGCEESGIVFLKRIGNYNVCRLNPGSPFLKDIENALKSRPTPQKAVMESLIREIRKIGDIERLVLFGSVSRNEERPGSDVDVALIVKKKTAATKNAVTDIVDKVMEKSRMNIVPIILTERDVEGKGQFSEEVRKGVVLYERPKRGRGLA
jgi:predicted nucleotidyltransferase